jgi:hypothetical protein
VQLAASRSLMCARSTPAAHSSSALLRDIANQNATNAFFADLVAIGVYCSTEQIKCNHLKFNYFFRIGLFC